MVSIPNVEDAPRRGAASRLPAVLLRVRQEFHDLPPARLAWWGLCTRILPDFRLVGARTRCWRWAGCKLGSAVGILGKLTLVGPGNVASRLHIGSGTLIAPEVTFGLDEEIHIGRNVSIGPGATLYTATHAVGFGSRRMTMKPSSRSIRIEDGVWVGMHCLILPGVTLGHGSVIAAGSVVTESVPPDSFIAGNPAVVQKTLPFGDR